MASGDGTSPRLVRAPGRTRAPGRVRTPGTRPPRRRRFLLPSAAVVVAMAGGVAVAVALVVTLIYASVDAGRPLGNEPTTVARGPSAQGPPTLPEPRSTTTKAPENLTNEQLLEKITASVRTVRTRDEAGEQVEGSAFVAGAFGGQTLLLTSLAVVRAGTRAPAPQIIVGERQEATLWTWQEDRDLALLVVGGSIETLPFLSSSSGLKTGDRVYTAARGKLSIGSIGAIAADGIEHNIVIDDVLQGAPLVNQKGEVLAMASRAYNPGGKGTDTLFIGVPISIACETVLRCGGGNTAPATSTPTTRA